MERYGEPRLQLAADERGDRVHTRCTATCRTNGVFDPLCNRLNVTDGLSLLDVMAHESPTAW